MQRTFQERSYADATEADGAIARYRGSFRASGELTWEQVLESRRVLLVAEAGAGKSYECERQAAALFDRGEAAFYLRLENVASHGVVGLLRPKQRKRFQAWRTSSSSMGYFFLDSIDELQLVHGSFKAALHRLSDDLGALLRRAIIVVTSRPVPIDRQAITDILPIPEQPTKIADGTEFVLIAMRSPAANEGDKQVEALKEITLLPLGDPQIIEFAREHGVDAPENLLREIDARNAHDFTRWPQELIELCDDWREHGQIRPHFKQVESHVQARLKARADRREKADLSVDKALKGAQRLALGVMLCRRWAFRYSAAADQPDSGEPAIDPAVLLDDWSTPEILTLLERPLFGDGGYGRARFRHRSVLEYLAACQIHSQIEAGTLSLSAAVRMLFAMSEANERISKPSLRPVAAWLALLRGDVLNAVVDVDPAILLIHGDPESLQPDQCSRALRAFVGLNGRGQWRGLDVPKVQVSRLARQQLGETVLSLWQAGVENPEIRSLLLQLIASGGYQECANLAACIAGDRNRPDHERFEALVALFKLGDGRLGGFIEAAMSVSSGWPQALGRWLGTYLYPDQITEEQLLKLLRKVGRQSRNELDYAASVAHTIERADVSKARLKSLVEGLTKMARRSIVLQEGELTEPADRLRASVILWSAAARLLAQGVHSDDVLLAAVIAFRASESSRDRTSSNGDLRKMIDDLPADQRARIFDLDYGWIAERYTDQAPRDVFYRIAWDGPLTFTRERDWSWILDGLRDERRLEAQRMGLLRLALHLSPVEDGKIIGRKAIRRCIADSAALVAHLDDAIDAGKRPAPELEGWARAQQKRAREREAKDAHERKQWMQIWRLLAKKPNLALAARRRDNTIWNIALALRNKPKSQGESRWDRAFLQRHFGKAATDALRQALMQYWRGLRPSVRSERKPDEKGTYLVVWSNALMGLYAEAEDPTWAAQLLPQEAELATRYALLELNGLPEWIVALGREFPSEVERVLGEEIEEELSEATEARWISIHLQALRYGHRETARLVEPRLIRWLLDAAPTLRRNAAQAEPKLESVTGVLLAQGSEPTRRWLADLAIREVGASANEALGELWMAVLFRADVHRGLVALLGRLAALPVEKDGAAIKIVGHLFNERSNPGATSWRGKLSPGELLQLVTAVFHHVRPAHDVVHEGVYSPGSRDHAEDGRRYVFDELMRTTGAGAMEAKMVLATHPDFADLADHITLLARERLAMEIDSSVFGADDVARLLKGRELTPKNGADMAYLLIDRLDDLQDLMLKDTAPREAWARVDDENALRPAIAREFEVAARGAYTVDQEAVTVDGKETDIRLRALSEQQATIELKIGEKSRSGRELRDTLELQLVKKYMQHSKARTGCLLVTVKDPAKSWQHPETGARMDRAGLARMLDDAAQALQRRLGGDVRVLARVLDLTPQLPTEATAAALKKKRRRAGRSAT